MAPPDVLRKSIDSFTRFYESKYRGRRITWNITLSRAEVRAYAQRTYDLQVLPTVQLAVLPEPLSMPPGSYCDVP